MKSGDIDRRGAYEQAKNVLKECMTPYGFKAAAKGKDGYERVWGRDSMICSLAALLTEDKTLHAQVKKSLLTLLKFQHKHGQIPSNVDVKKKRVSYGGGTGRIDSMLWFLIGFGQYVRRTNDIVFAERYYKKFKKTIGLVNLYEFNDRGFIYIPKTGDWADEYIQEGYILYDQLLYYKALQEYIYIRRKLGKSVEKQKIKCKELKRKILVNFILERKNITSKYVYSKTLFEKSIKKKKYSTTYLLPYFNPSEYGYRFDGFANSMALHCGIFTQEKENELIQYIEKTFSVKTHFLIPAFYPPITKRDPEWAELIENYSTSFKNEPYQFHNGGLWPMITGFYASALSKKYPKKALGYLDGINWANEKDNWGFPEYLNGKTFMRGGKQKQAWSAAAGIIAYETIINKKSLFI
ncbi:MAG: glycogen debranching protein [Nanoarchaeota archaeon]|nr:glycogen debranching protein [Nanoarchaeota archaeon]